MEAAEEAAMGSFTFRGEVFDLTKASWGRRGGMIGMQWRGCFEHFPSCYCCCCFWSCCLSNLGCFLLPQRAERAVALEVACLLHQLSAIVNPSPLKGDGEKLSLFSGLLTSPQVTLLYSFTSIMLPPLLPGDTIGMK